MSDNRPNPLARVATTVGGVVAGLVGIVGAFVQFHALTQAQADALTYAGAQLPDAVLAVGTLVTLLTGLVGGLAAAFGTAKVGKHEVTPISDPRDNAGNALVPAAGPVI